MFLISSFSALVTSFCRCVRDMAVWKLILYDANDVIGSWGSNDVVWCCRLHCFSEWTSLYMLSR
jgi:hypothetical protein